jgi:hypothetical protein
MDYEMIRMLSRVRIERSAMTEELYRSEEEAQRAVTAAAAHLGRVMPSSAEVHPEPEDVLALELAALLDYFGRAGTQAARLIVERYGEEDPEIQSGGAGCGVSSGMPKPDALKTLKYLADLDAHTVYKVEAVREKLKECGFLVKDVVRVKGLLVNGVWMRPVVPEWGKPGIDASQVLELAFRVLTGEEPVSDLSGRGFRFNDILNQLRTRLRQSEDS